MMNRSQQARVHTPASMAEFIMKGIGESVNAISRQP